MFLYSQEEFKINFVHKDVLKNKKKNMEKINYDKLQHDIRRNKHFTMIERPGPSKHFDIETLLSISKDFQYFVPITEDIPRNQTEHFSTIFRHFLKTMQCLHLCKQQRKMERNIIKNVNKNVLTENGQN